jgi:uncharacterized membrane protein
MTSITNESAKSGWWIPVGLLALSLLPLLGGTLRLVDLTSNELITEDNARFMAAPASIVMHVIAASVYFVLGAFQFWPRIRNRNPGWHRNAGRVLFPAGLIAAVSGMWMAVTYPPIFGDGTALTILRLLAGVAIVISLVLGLFAIKRKSIVVHQAWMTRAYALMIAAGTQPLTLGAAFLISGKLDELAYTSGMGAGWLLNIVAAEWFIRKRSAPASSEVATASAAFSHSAREL